MTTLGYLRGVRESLYPTRKSSAFLEKGVLTPEEYVKAGDELVFRCPTWRWESGDPKKIKSYLPPDKQYLVTRNVPCSTRVAEMEHAMTMTSFGGNDDDDEGDWLISSVIQRDQNLEDEFDILDEEGEVVMAPGEGEKKKAKESPKQEEEEEAVQEDDEYADMDAFEDDNVLVDDDAVVPGTDNDGDGAAGDDDDDDDNLMQVRTYDLSITYDKYYQTPRVWMMGYAPVSRQPLTGNSMMEDVISDYRNRTVTIEHHPHVSGPHASIHPCQHGKVMKTIVKNLMKHTTNDEEAAQGDEVAQQQQQQGPAVEMYLFIFLKFVSSIIPTISYDFTMDVTADTSK